MTLTPEEYLELERLADHKSEYWHGQIYAMAGVSLPHSAIQSSLLRHLGNQLAHTACAVHGSDVKVGVHRGKHGLAYPDAFVICGAPAFLDHHHDVITNPVVIFEILSPSTEDHDRGGKFVEYRRLDSLRHYVLIAQDRLAVEHYARQNEASWTLHLLKAGDLLRLPELALEMPIDLLYERVELPAEQV